MGELRIALRSLASGKFATVGAVLALSLGIAGTATFLTLLNALFVRTLPVAHPEHLFVVATGNEPYAYVRYSVFEYLTEHEALPRAFAFSTGRVDVSPSPQKQFVEALFVSKSAFDVLQMQPSLGRLLAETDISNDVATPVVLGYNYWQSQHGGAADETG